jgi:hypothetical protein
MNPLNTIQVELIDGRTLFIEHECETVAEALITYDEMIQKREPVGTRAREPRARSTPSSIAWRLPTGVATGSTTRRSTSSGASR